MVKLVCVVRRRSDFSPEAFRKRWLAHGPLVKDVAKAIRARKYIQSHTLDTELNALLAASREMGPAFDGIAEVWWDSLDDILAAAGTAEGQAAFQCLLDDERQFIDLAHSFLFLTQERTIFEL